MSECKKDIDLMQITDICTELWKFNFKTYLYSYHGKYYITIVIFTFTLYNGKLLGHTY